MIYATANIEVPNIFVNVAMPFRRGQHQTMQTVDYDLVSDSGERVAAQAVKVGRYHDGSIQVAHLYGKFSSPASKITVQERKAVPKAFEFTAFTEAQFLKYSRGRAKVRLEFNGPVVKRLSLFATTGQVPIETHLTFYTGEDVIRVDSCYHNSLPLAAEDLVTINLHSSVDAQEIPITVPEPVLPITGYFPQRARRIVRTALLPIGKSPDKITHDAGWGVVDEFQRVEAFTAMQLRVPNFANVNLRGRQNNDYFTALQAMQNGTGYPSSKYLNSKRLGMFHPCLGFEGGETGGLWINQGSGADVAFTGNVNALRLAYLEQRMVTDRHHVGLVDMDGNFATLERYEGISGWRMRSDDGRFEKTSGGEMDGPWGFSAQPPLDPLIAPEKTTIDKFEPLDWAHLIRAHKSNFVLAWLANDPIAKSLIQQDAELARMSWFFQRLHNDDNIVRANPHKGNHYSRIQGWMLRIIAESYALSSDKLRSRFSYHSLQLQDTVELAETPIGLVNCDTQGKEFSKPPYDKKYGVSVCIQHGLFTGGYYAFCRAFGLNFGLKALEGVKYLLQGSNTIWSAAIRLKDPKSSVFNSRQLDASGLPLDSNHPLYPDGKPTAGNVDSEQTRSVVGLCGLYGLETGNQALVDEAVVLAKQMMGQTPTQALLNLALNVNDSDLILLSFCQRVGLP